MKIRFSIFLILLAKISVGQFLMGGDQKFDQMAEPEVRWTFSTRGPITGSPFIDNGTVYIGSTDSTLYALDLQSGKLKWKFPTGGAIRSSVCNTPERLFLLSTDGILYRLEKDSGKVDGFFQTTTGYMGDSQRDFADYFTSTPVVHDSVIYFGCGTTIYAVSIIDGFIRWTFKAGDVVHTMPAIRNGRLYAGSFDGYLYSIDIRTGALDWKFKSTGNMGFPKGEFMGNPVVAGNSVIAGARDYNLYAVDLRGGFCNWMKQFPAGWGLPVTMNDTVIYVGTSDDRTLLALDIRSGYPYWSINTEFNVFGGVALGKDVGYLGTLAGKLHGIDLKKGKIIWTANLASFNLNHAKWIKEDGNYRPDIGNLIRTPNDILKMYRDLGGIFGTPAVDNSGFIVVAGYDGQVTCFAPKTGK